MKFGTKLVIAAWVYFAALICFIGFIYYSEWSYCEVNPCTLGGIGVIVAVLGPIFVLGSLAQKIPIYGPGPFYDLLNVAMQSALTIAIVFFFVGIAVAMTRFIESKDGIFGQAQRNLSYIFWFLFFSIAVPYTIFDIYQLTASLF